jgi:hypothetical protein
MNLKQKNLTLLAALTSIIVCSLISLISIPANLEFSSAKTCLLYVENYHKNNDTYVFDAYSGACSAVFSWAVITLLVAICLVAATVYVYKTDRQVSRRSYYYIAITCVFISFIQLVMASIVSAGLSKTCSEFVKNDRGSSCSSVFNDGFFSVGTDGKFTGHSKSFSSISSVQGANWVQVIFWGLTTFCVWAFWKESSDQWWQV